MCSFTMNLEKQYSFQSCQKEMKKTIENLVYCNSFQTRYSDFTFAFIQNILKVTEDFWHKRSQYMFLFCSKLSSDFLSHSVKPEVYDLQISTGSASHLLPYLPVLVTSPLQLHWSLCCGKTYLATLSLKSASTYYNLCLECSHLCPRY